MKLITILFALLSFTSIGCSTSSGRGPSSTGMEVTQMPGFVNNAKIYRLKDSENNVVCYGAIASEDSQHASAGHFQCLSTKGNVAPAAAQATP
jgi:predicted small secreted protein